VTRLPYLQQSIQPPELCSISLIVSLVSLSHVVAMVSRQMGLTRTPLIRSQTPGGAIRVHHCAIPRDIHNDAIVDADELCSSGHRPDRMTRGTRDYILTYRSTATAYTMNVQIFVSSIARPALCRFTTQVEDAWRRTAIENSILLFMLDHARDMRAHESDKVTWRQPGATRTGLPPNDTIELISYPR
jgi:hypothetical protein